jgi:hypothetical protein
MISIYLIDLRRRIAGVAFDSDVSHRLSMTLKSSPKLACVVLAGAL